MSEIPYGAWPSPLSAGDVAGDTLEFVGIAVESGTPYWLERRPDEGGRGAVVRVTDDGRFVEVTPGEVDVQTTVHEYGGGGFAVDGETVVFSRFDDQRLYRTGTHDEDVEPITPEPPEEAAYRYADAEFTPDGGRLYCVRERHHGDDVDEEAVNELVVLPVAGDADPTVVASGHDFYSFPRVSPDGDRLAWTTWDHPQMPWDGTELHLADVDADGTLSGVRTVAGGPGESLFQPSWGPEDTLHVVSDRTGWWNIYRFDGETLSPVREDDAEYGMAQWGFGMATYQVLDDGTIVAIRTADGSQELVRVDPETGALDPTDLPYEAFPYAKLASDGEVVCAVAGGPTTPPTVVQWTPGEEPTVCRRAFDLDLGAEHVAEPTQVTFPTGKDGAERAHALYYPPTNPDVEAPDDERPPLLVTAHGGPTSQTLPLVDSEIQYFTTRGFGVVDVNYRGSTGYGRAYRERLDGAWGVADARDCVEAARYLVAEGEADPDRLAIRGGSAGGYATLCGVTFYDAFDAGASYYGVGDLRRLAEHTHKFESRYLDGLVGPLPEAESTYEERSPVEHAAAVDAPLLVLQGGEDRVVPPKQAEDIVSKLVEEGTPYVYVEFSEERHGFRDAESTRTALVAELGFYGTVFGFEPAGEATPLDLDRHEYRKRTGSDLAGQ